MARRDAGAQLGDKLGPRLVDLVTQGVLAARRSLAPHEARVHAAGLQQVIDRLGLEVAGHHAGIIGQLLAADEDMPEWLQKYLRDTASGRHQWQAVSGVLGLTGITGGIGTIMTNYLAHSVQGLVGLDPSLQIDQNTAAQCVARGVLDFASAEHYARQAGFAGDQLAMLVDLSYSYPDVSTILELYRRGELSQDTDITWMVRQGIPPGIAGTLRTLSRNLLSADQAADAVLRGVIADGAGRAIAAQNGITGADFEVMVALTGEPLGLEQLLEAYRRGIIDTARLDRGIKQSRVRDEWVDVATALRYQPVSAADAIDAWQRGRIPQAEAVTLAEQAGVSPQQVPILMANAGAPPAPEQLMELWRRGYLTEAEVNTGLQEGRLRNEWIPALRNLRYSPISTADALDAWQRGHLTEAQATQVAEANGVEPSQVAALLANQGNPLALEQLLEAWRRGIIDEAQVDKGIREGRTRDDWITAAKGLRYSPMSTADAVAAAVQNVIPAARAKEITTQNGLLPADFDYLLEAAGSPLARTELQQLYNRGLISIEAYEQGLRESRLKDKYVKIATALHTRLPEPRVITEAIADGVISTAAGKAKLKADGYSDADADMLVTLGEVRSTGGHKELMTGEISSLYADRIITAGQAESMLAQLHYTPAASRLIMDLADYKLHQKILNAGITSVKNAYVGYHSDNASATADLTALGLPSTAIATYLKTWQIERADKVKQLTEAQIVKAVRLNLLVPQKTLTQAQWEAANHDAGISRLTRLGYTAGDAQLLLSGA